METIKWLFFDIGSTLIDESTCYARRFLETTEGTNVSLQTFREKVIQLAAVSDDPYKEAVRLFGLQKAKWHSALEKPFPYASLVLQTLSKSYRLGILANQPAGAKQRLDAWNIGQYFDLILASAEEGLAKPDPAFFQLALQRAGCLPQEAVMVGDRLDNDILPAKKCGMKTIWVRQGYAELKAASDLPDFTVDSLADIPSIL